MTTTTVTCLRTVRGDVQRWATSQAGTSGVVPLAMRDEGCGGAGEVRRTNARGCMHSAARRRRGECCRVPGHPPLSFVLGRGVTHPPASPLQSPLRTGTPSRPPTGRRRRSDVDAHSPSAGFGLDSPGAESPPPPPPSSSSPSSGDEGAGRHARASAAARHRGRGGAGDPAATTSEWSPTPARGHRNQPEGAAGSDTAGAEEDSMRKSARSAQRFLALIPPPTPPRGSFALPPCPISFRLATDAIAVHLLVPLTSQSQYRRLLAPSSPSFIHRRARAAMLMGYWWAGVWVCRRLGAVLAGLRGSLVASPGARPSARDRHRAFLHSLSASDPDGPPRAPLYFPSPPFPSPSPPPSRMAPLPRASRGRLSLTLVPLCVWGTHRVCASPAQLARSAPGAGPVRSPLSEFPPIAPPPPFPPFLSCLCPPLPYNACFLPLASRRQWERGIKARVNSQIRDLPAPLRACLRNRVLLPLRSTRCYAGTCAHRCSLSASTCLQTSGRNSNARPGAKPATSPRRRLFSIARARTATAKGARPPSTPRKGG